MTNITMLVANRPRLTKQSLDSIGDLSNATVMIRDAGMNKEIGEVVHAWRSSLDSIKHSAIYQKLKPTGTGPARNEVIAVSEHTFGRGKYLYLSDDDVFFKHGWLETMTQAYPAARSNGFRVIGCYNHPFNKPISYPGLRVEIKNCIPCADTFSRLHPGSSNIPCDAWFIHEVYAVATQSMLMDWETWDEFGPFCDTPAGKVCQSEDVDFCNRIRAAGYKVGVISPALLVNCGITNSFGEKIVGWEMVKAEAPEGVICE